MNGILCNQVGADCLCRATYRHAHRRNGRGRTTVRIQGQDGVTRCGKCAQKGRAGARTLKLDAVDTGAGTGAGVGQVGNKVVADVLSDNV